MHDSDEVMTVEEMGRVLRVSRPTAYQLAGAKDGPPVLHIGRSLRIPRRGLMEWIERNADKDNDPC